MAEPRHSKRQSLEDPRRPRPNPSGTSQWLAQDIEKPHYWRRFLHLCRDNLSIIALCALGLVLISVLEGLLTQEFRHWDALGYRYIVENRQEWLTPFMEQLTMLASPAVLLVMLVLVAAFAPGRRPGLCAAVNLVCVVALTVLLKDIVQRQRPDGFRLIAETGYSFPSGHSMVSMAFFGLLIWMIWRYEPDRRMRWLWCAFLCLVIPAVGISRIYLGVHYTSDVIAGFCVSIVWLIFYVRVVAPVFMWKPVNPAKHTKK